jgi:hypothetical protein
MMAAGGKKETETIALVIRNLVKMRDYWPCTC